MIPPDALPNLEPLAAQPEQSLPLAPPEVPESGCDLSYAPALAWLTAFAALLDLAVNRLAVIATVQLSTAARALIVQSWGRLPLHLLGISGLVVLYGTLVRYLRMAGYSGIVRRLALATTSGVLLPALAVTVFYPREVISQALVFLLVMAVHMVIAIVAGNAVRFRVAIGTSRERRVAYAAWISALLTLTLLVMIAVRARFPGWGAFLSPVSQTLRFAGEFSWLIVPFFAVPMLQITPARMPGERRRHRIGRALRALTSARPGIVALSVFALLAIGSSALAWELRPHVSRLVYSAFRVAVLTERLAIAYLLWVAANLSIGIGLLFHARSSSRQMGAALLLWCAAGFGPRAPSQALCLCLAVLLITRVVQAVSEHGRQEAMRPWGSQPPR